MLPWIENLEEGQSAFDNNSDELKPHRVIDGKIVLTNLKMRINIQDRFMIKVAPCIHTRNDQIGKSNTIHPIDNRVFSIRELMRMMTIPDELNG